MSPGRTASPEEIEAGERVARLKDYIAEDDIGGQLAAMASEDDIDEQSMLAELDEDCARDGTAEAARAPMSRSRAAIEICFFIF
jgi:hypothetical protein